MTRRPGVTYRDAGGRPIGEAEFRRFIGARDTEDTMQAAQRVWCQAERGRGHNPPRRSPTPMRNTIDDAMSLAELIGLPDLDEREAVQIFLEGPSTRSAATKVRARQEAAWRARGGRSDHPLKAEAVVTGAAIRQEHPNLSTTAVAIRVARRLGVRHPPAQVPSERVIRRWLA